MFVVSRDKQQADKASIRDDASLRAHALPRLHVARRRRKAGSGAPLYFISTVKVRWVTVLSFARAPSERARKLSDIHVYDCKIPSAPEVR
jgi:hypothetical protein